MHLYEKELTIPHSNNGGSLFDYFADAILSRLDKDEIPLRIAITRTTEKGYHCELGILGASLNTHSLPRNSIFNIKKRTHENADSFNAVLLVPTGIGAEIGGHSGDGGALSRLIASSCDTLITHPNVVNAADINELPENGLYVEGSVICRLLSGSIGLQKVRSNRVALFIDDHEDSYISDATINSVSAARSAMGLDCPIVVKMKKSLTMQAMYSSSGRAIGKVTNLERLCAAITDHLDQFDAAAFSTIIKVPTHFHGDYFKKDIVNPWGGVEAMLTHAISTLYNIPSAHSPMTENREIMNLDVGIVDPRKSAEAVSVTYLQSVLKGLQKSPRIVDLLENDSQKGAITAEDVSCLIIPNGVLGLPTLAALEQGIPVIAVKENVNRMDNALQDLPWQPGKYFEVENYLEAVGVMQVLKSGVTVESIRRPIELTNVITHEYKHPLREHAEPVSDVDVDSQEVKRMRR